MKRASLIYCSVIAVAGAMVLGSGRGVPILGYLSLFIILLGGACGGDIVRLTCKPDMIFSSTTGGLIRGKLFWFCGIQIMGAVMSVFVTSYFLNGKIAIVVSLIIIGIHFLINGSEDVKNVTE